jgi:hypothetical protein
VVSITTQAPLEGPGTVFCAINGKANKANTIRIKIFLILFFGFFAYLFKNEHFTRTLKCLDFFKSSLIGPKTYLKLP